MGYVPLPKSVNEQRIYDNAGVYGFELTPEEVKMLDTGEYSPTTGWDPIMTAD